MRNAVLILLLLPVTVRAQPAKDLPNASAIRSYYEAGLLRNGIVGSSLTLVRNGEVVWKDNVGLQSRNPAKSVDDNTTYHWASVTKSFTGIAIMQLRDRGCSRSTTRW